MFTNKYGDLFRGKIIGSQIKNCFAYQYVEQSLLIALNLGNMYKNIFFKIKKDLLPGQVSWYIDLFIN